MTRFPPNVEQIQSSPTRQGNGVEIGVAVAGMVNIVQRRVIVSPVVDQVQDAIAMGNLGIEFFQCVAAEALEVLLDRHASACDDDGRTLFGISGGWSI